MSSSFVSDTDLFRAFEQGFHRFDAVASEQARRQWQARHPGEDFFEAYTAYVEAYQQQHAERKV